MMHAQTFSLEAIVLITFPLLHKSHMWTFQFPGIKFLINSVMLAPARDYCPLQRPVQCVLQLRWEVKISEQQAQKSISHLWCWRKLFPDVTSTLHVTLTMSHALPWSSLQNPGITSALPLTNRLWQRVSMWFPRLCYIMLRLGAREDPLQVLKLAIVLRGGLQGGSHGTVLEMTARSWELPQSGLPVRKLWSQLYNGKEVNSVTIWQSSEVGPSPEKPLMRAQSQPTPWLPPGKTQKQGAQQNCAWTSGLPKVWANKCVCVRLQICGALLHSTR